MRQIGDPYKIQVVHELKPANPGKCIAFCNWLLRCISRSHSVLDTVFFSDEAWFYLSGHVNAQNYHVWWSINPHQYVETTFHPQKLGVWCAIMRKCLVGPIFSPALSLQKSIKTLLPSLLSSCRNLNVMWSSNETTHDRMCLHERWISCDRFLGNASFLPVCGPHEVSIWTP